MVGVITPTAVSIIQRVTFSYVPLSLHFSYSLSLKSATESSFGSKIFTIIIWGLLIWLAYALYNAFTRRAAKYVLSTIWMNVSSQLIPSFAILISSLSICFISLFVATVEVGQVMAQAATGAVAVEAGAPMEAKTGVLIAIIMVFYQNTAITLFILGPAPGCGPAYAGPAAGYGGGGGGFWPGLAAGGLVPIAHPPPIQLNVSCSKTFFLFCAKMGYLLNRRPYHPYGGYGGYAGGHAGYTGGYGGYHRYVVVCVVCVQCT